MKFAHLLSSTVDTVTDSFLEKPEAVRSPWLILCNAQSLFRKLDELKVVVAACMPQLVCVTETWFHPNIENSLIEIPGFISFRNDRQDNPEDKRRGGGTVIYASSKSRFPVL